MKQFTEGKRIFDKGLRRGWGMLELGRKGGWWEVLMVCKKTKIDRKKIMHM